MEIVYLEAKHLSKVLALEKEAFGKNALTEESLHSFINAFYKGCFVAVQGAGVLGYITSERHLKESPVVYNHNAVATHFPNGPFLYISGIVIDTENRGRGIGSFLLKRLEKEAAKEGCFAVYIILNANHPYGEKAFNFWRKNGFSEKARLEWAFQENIFIEGILFEKKM